MQDTETMSSPITEPKPDNGVDQEPEANPELVIHIWPSQWDLPSFTPDCLAAVLYAQLAIPGKFVIQECTNPDESPNGQLPYITHGLACIASFPSIVKYICGLHEDGFLQPEEGEGCNETDLDHGAADNRADLSAPLSAEQRAQQTAWLSFVSSHLGDLLACSFFTLRRNYHEFLRPALSELFSVPQRYYVPDRLRAMYKPRLQAAGLWTVQAEEAEEKRKKEQQSRASIRSLVHDSAITETFGNEKVVEKAHTELGLLSRLLGTGSFFFSSDRPMTLDVLVAAHILLLTQPKFPNDLLKVLIEGEFPSLVILARRVQTHALGSDSLLHAELALSSASVMSSYDMVGSAPAVQAPPIAPLCVRPVRKSDLVSTVVQLWPFWQGRQWRTQHHTTAANEKSGEEKKEEKLFNQMRWAWYGLSAFCILGWVVSNVEIRFNVIDEDEEGEKREAFKHSQGKKEDEKNEGDEEGEGDEDEVNGEDLGSGDEDEDH